MRRIITLLLRKNRHSSHCKGRDFPIQAMSELFGLRGAPCQVLFFGDSVAERVAREDKDTRTLDRMTADFLKGHLTLRGITNSAYHSGVFYMLLQTLQLFVYKPSIAILPINMRSFSPQWDLNPEFQCSDDIKNIKNYITKHGGRLKAPLYDTDRRTPLYKFLNTAVEFPDTSFRHIRQFINIINSKPKNEKERTFRLKQIFTYHYLYPLTMSNRKLRLLKAALNYCQALNIKVAAYITPVNYRSGVKYAGRYFAQICNSNVKMIFRAFETKPNTIILRDYSTLFTPDFFFNEDNSTEHLNQRGRLMLSKEIADMCLTLNKRMS